MEKGGNWTGENFLDLEPDDYKGTKNFYQRIDYLSTFGTGNDFTIGTRKNGLEKWILDIGQFHVLLMEGVKGGLQSYAVTLKIDKLFMQALSNHADSGLDLSYAAIWEINEDYFVNGKGYAIVAKEQEEEKPNIKVGKLFISRPEGKGLELWGADATIDYFEANTVQGQVLKVFATNDQQVTIQHFISRNSSENEVIHISDYGFQPFVKVGNLFISDNRSTKASNIVYLDTQKAVNGLEIDTMQNFDYVSELSFGPTVTNQNVVIRKKR